MNTDPDNGAMGRRAIWIAACVLPLLVWMLLPGNPRVAGICHDDGSYFVIGQSIVERGTYRYRFYPEPIETAKYPPGVPLIAAACFAITRDLDWTMTAVRIVNALFLGLALYSFWNILAREGVALAAPPLVFALGWSTWSADFVRVCMSEIPYLGISLFAVDRLLRYESETERPWRHALVLAGVCFAAFATRSIGLVLLGTVGLHLLVARRFPTAIRFGAIVLPLVLALQFFMSAVSTPQESYEDVTVYGLPYSRIFLESLDWVGATIWTNALQAALVAMQQVLPPTTWISPLNTPGLVALWLCVLIVFASMWIGGRHEYRDAGNTPRIRPWHILVLGSVALVLPWPASVGRFLIPLLPFFLLMIVRGAERLAGRRAVLWTAVALGVGSATHGMASRIVQRQDAMAFAGRTYDIAGLRAFSHGVREHTAGTDAIVACTADSLLGSHDRVLGVWGWTITADEHLYRNPGNSWQFNIGISKWEWIRRELFAARILYLELTKSEILPDAYAAMQQMYGVRSPQREGHDRELLLRELERDASSVRDQYRRLGVTHAALLLSDGNPLYDVLLARLVRRLVSEDRAELVREVSSESFQLYRIRP